MAKGGFAAAALAALALLPGRAGAAPAPAGRPVWARARTVTVAMVDFRFVPDHLDFHAGVAYRLRFVNKSPLWHEFTAPGFFKAVSLGNPQALHPYLAVAPGKSGDLLFLAPHPGHFRFHCVDHGFAGMVGTITVK